MKLSDISIGKRYRARISGNYTTVRVASIRECYGSRKNITTINEATGRECVMSAAKLRFEIKEPSCSPA